MAEKSLKELYRQQACDEKITEFSDASGFSLIRTYPEGSAYAKDDMRMFMKVGILNGHFSYAVEMTKPKEYEGKIEYIITEGDKYKMKVTNFFSDRNSDEFNFDQATDSVTHIKTGKKLSMNEFVEVLAFNHLSDMLFWKRKLNTLAETMLTVMFWLADKRYEKIQVSIDIYHFKRDGKSALKKQDNIEPFFKYFYISKNLLFALLIVTFTTAVLFSDLWQLGDFSVSNPTILLLFFLVLFSCERFSLWLERKIKQLLEKDQSIFKEEKGNFIERLHNFQERNQFTLKLK